MTEKFLSLGINYLGFLNAQLRDLRGYSTLANELIQNADDAPGATSIIFDVRDDGLVVENDGLFSDCGRMRQDDCPWLEDESKRHRCDFHRFRLTASGDKRRQEETTGAFGIGFISVYQITDRPELKSGNRHWVIRPEKPREERILARPISENLDGTRFYLPWAMDHESQVRRALGVEQITDSNIQTMAIELGKALPSAILFLRKISSIELRQNGRLLKRIERLREEDEVIVEVEGGIDTTRLWYLLEDEFEDKASDIRARAEHHIESNRQARVAIGLPEETSGVIGVFHASLPTEHQIGVPFHINADFFTSTDRKRVLFDADYQGDWNRAAVEAAATSFAQALPDLPEQMDYLDLWKLLSHIREVARDAEVGRQPDVLEAFWKEIRPVLREEPLVFTSLETWSRPQDVFFLRNRKEEEACLPILEELGLDITHPELTPHANLLQEIGVRALGPTHLAQALQKAGLDHSIQLDSAPRWIRSPENRGILGDEIELLLQRRTRGSTRSQARQEMAGCAIARSTDGWLCPPHDLRRASSKTMEAFEALDPGATFADPDNPEPIQGLVSHFSVEDGIELLERVPAEVLVRVWRDSPKQILELIGWFADQPTEFRDNADLVHRLRQLPLWPSGDVLYRLGELVIPGDFEDPLDLTSVIDRRVLQRCSDFLIKYLNASELTVETYASEFVPGAFAPDKEIAPDARRQLALVLAQNLGKLRDSDTANEALRGCALVECRDGTFREPKRVYFESSLVDNILGERAMVAVIPSDHKEAVTDFFEWLGVTDVPRPVEVIERVKDIVTTNLPVDSHRQVIKRMFTEIGQHWQTKYRSEQHRFKSLERFAWLPAEGDHEKWHVPSDVFAGFRRYIFETQARFLDIPLRDQRNSSDFIEFLGIREEPSPAQVVQHLKTLAQNERPMASLEIYRFLNENVGEPEILDLQGIPCLYLEGGKYVRPDQVYWGSHSFGRYRYRLSEELRQYGRLLKVLGVRESPEPQDAIAVIRGIGDELGNNPLDEEASRVLLHCWTMLSEALEVEQVDPADIAQLQSEQAILDTKKILNRPERMFFEDRPRLAEKFGEFLERNVIARPHGAWRAMQAAGVRPLSQAMDMELIDCADPNADKDLLERIRDRKPLMQRVLADVNTYAWNLDILNHLQLLRARELALEYSLDIFNRFLKTGAESVTAYYDQDNQILYYRSDGDGVPWPALARELSYALNSDAEAGQVASGLKEILSARSYSSAENTLDELGFAPLESLPKSEPDEAESVGFEEDGDREIEQDGGWGYEHSGGEEPDTTDSVDEVEGESEPDPTGQNGGPGETEDTGERLTGPGGKAGKSGSGGTQQGRYVTYLYVGQDGDETSEGTGEQGREDKDRIAVDRAGIRHVLSFERRAGRHPKEMPHHNPGYDIESQDNTGDVVRYIEVKSISDEWGERGVSLSETQFRRAEDLKDKYWLYVVENADKGNANIICIQDPANRVDHFVYDHYWRGVGELVSTGQRRSILDLKPRDNLRQ